MKRIFLLFFLAAFFSCASDGFMHSERREGFSGISLRVYVRDYKAAKNDEDVKKAEGKLMNMAAKRGSVLLAGYILTKLDLSERAVLLRLDSSVRDILSKGKLIHMGKKEEYYEAFVDYDTGTFLSDVDRISLRQKGLEEKKEEEIK